jgi:hypothetical protein
LAGKPAFVIQTYSVNIVILENETNSKTGRYWFTSMAGTHGFY